MGTVDSDQCGAKAADVWVKSTDVQRAKVADVLLSRTRIGYKVSVCGLGIKDRD